ncbi:hypothetical protein C8Q77DRAFT_580611 [Trametes polyzona]|nr:hypothetical protein C8Q77DRAFT_580611 [Trametes polyzona]
MGRPMGDRAHLRGEVGVCGRARRLRCRGERTSGGGGGRVSGRRRRGPSRLQAAGDDRAQTVHSKAYIPMDRGFQSQSGPVLPPAIADRMRVPLAEQALTASCSPSSSSSLAISLSSVSSLWASAGDVGMEARRSRCERPRRPGPARCPLICPISSLLFYPDFVEPILPCTRPASSQQDQGSAFRSGALPTSRCLRRRQPSRSHSLGRPPSHLLRLLRRALDSILLSAIVCAYLRSKLRPRPPKNPGRSDERHSRNNPDADQGHSGLSPLQPLPCSRFHHFQTCRSRGMPNNASL